MRSSRLAARAALTIAALLVSTTPAAYAGSNWPVYHGDRARTANDTTEPSLLPLHTGWTRGLDGKVYAQPLVFAGRVFAATENNTVYALDGHDGKVLWSRHLGPAMTNVNGQVGCGNIDPLGITSTPVVDIVSKTIYVVATVQDAPGVIHHQLVALAALTGTPRLSVNADPGGGQNPLFIQQRAGLALGNGRVYIGYGGYAGDCGPYHGWLVSLDENGNGKVAFDVTPNLGPAGQGAIWTPGGASIDGAGHVYVATGNPDPDNSGDFGESVLKFDSTSGMHRTGAFKTFPGGDNDLGSMTPSVLGSNLLFQVGKQHTGYLLDSNSMTSLQSMHVCNGDARGATAFDGFHLFVPCQEHLQQVLIDSNHRSMVLGWAGPATTNAGPPILAGGVVWYIDYPGGTLRGLDPASGALRATVALGSVPHFASPSAALGLLLIGTDAGVTALAGPAGVPGHAPSACLAQSDHTGYWMTARNGDLFAFGSAPNCGGLTGVRLARPIVGMAGTSGPGYWLVASDGGIFAFNRPFFGSMGGKPLNRPIVGMAATPSGKGYWLVASDGGIFTFGDARFRGSTGGKRLNQPIIGMAATPSGNGYWLVASDGGIFTFGDAHFHGSKGGAHLNRPIAGMAATPTGNGYWLVASDGGIFTFGDAPFRGSTGGRHLVAPIAGMAATASGNGYWLVASDGGVFTFNAPFRGAATGLTSASPVVAIAHD